MKRLLALIALCLLFVQVPGSAGAITNGQKDEQRRLTGLAALCVTRISGGRDR
jgi:hypothetical protein